MQNFRKIISILVKHLESVELFDANTNIISFGQGKDDIARLSKKING
jgi:hypothetical protein